jgi:recombination protein RecA
VNNGSMTESERQRAIRLRLARTEPQRVIRISTGFPSLDHALEGGLPRGHITELSGGPSSGKSTFALMMVAHAQQEGLAAAWIDVERGFDPAYASHLGVSLERLPVARPETAEEALEIARQLTGSRGIELLVLDSAAALTPAIELEMGMGGAGPGLQARVLASGFRRLALSASRTETAILVLNQIRSGGGGESQETSAGGPAVKLHSILRIALEPLETASRIRFRILKSRLAAPVREGELLFETLHGPSVSP